MSESIPGKRSILVERCLDLHLRNKRAKQCLKYGSVNLALLIVLLYDISNKCPYSFSNWYYVEYAAASVIGLGVFLYFCKYFYYIFIFAPVKGSTLQRDLLKFEKGDGSFITTQLEAQSDKSLDKNATPVNATLLSWHSSFNESNRNLSLGSWIYSRNSPPRSTNVNQQNLSWTGHDSSTNALSSNNSSFCSPYKNKTRANEVFVDEKELQKYLRDVLKNEYLSEYQETQNSFGTTSINSFWNYCSTAATLLKTSLYQLSPSTVSPGKQTNKDESGLFGLNNDLDGNSEIIKTISSAKLSQYVANLRMWISSTILQRIENEINKIDTAFRSRGFSEIQIGSVGLERLKKTAENQQFVAVHVPMLPLIVPFLEMSTNQEYLVQRIKDLARGSCIATYRWNSGSSYHGLSWDEHLPTDSAILFHLFCTYLDSQLMPLPQPGGRPFFNRYVIMGDKKSAKETIAEVKNKPRCSILYTNQLKPKFNLISDDKIHNCVHDRNNLFYVIIQFLIYMKTKNNGLLEGVNLGKSGINILCVIED